MAEINATVTDNSKETITIVDTITNVKLDTVGTYYVTFNAKDSSGNEATEVVVKVIVEDTTGPEITIDNPEVTIEINGGTVAEDLITLAGIIATDNSKGEVTITSDFDAVVDQTKLDSYTVTVTATDPSGIKTTGTVKVTVADTTNPLLEVANDVVIIEINSNMTETQFFAEVGITSSDNSGETPTITNDFDKVVQSVLDDTIVTITAKDSSGNTTIVEVVVTVVDKTPPVINITNPKVEIEINGGTTPDEIISLAGITATDNSGETPTITTDFNLVVHQNEKGVYTVTITASDSEGNQSTATFEVVVIDSIAPEITIVNPKVEIEINGGTTEEDIIKLAGVDATDNSGKAPTITTDFDDVVDQTTPGDYKVTITAKDSDGNITTDTIVVTVEDTTAPVITIVDPEVSIEINGGTTEEDIIKLAGIEATDNSGEKPTITTDFDTTVDQTTPGKYDVIITATDKAGNVSTETIVVTIEDTTGPVITIDKPEVSIEINGGTTEEDIIKLAGIDATDNSGETPTITTDFDAVVDQTKPGDYTVTITVTDSAGNVTTDTIVVTIEDTTAPELTLTNDVVEINLNNPLSDEEFIKLVGPVTSDNSKGKVTVTTDFDLVDQKNPLGEYTVTITATDEADRVIIDVKDLDTILALDNVEDKVIELLNAKAWLDDAINGITDLPVYIKNYEEMINFLSRKDLANGDLLDVILTTNNPLSRSLFGSETVAQIEITGVVEDLPVVDETPKLPATGVGNSYIALYGGVLAVFGGLILSYSKKKKEEENC